MARSIVDVSNQASIKYCIFLKCLLVYLIFIFTSIRPVASECSLAGYDVKNLTSPKTLDCKSIVTNFTFLEGELLNVTNCSITFSLCEALPKNPCSQDAGGCLTTVINNETTYTGLGKYSPNPFVKGVQTGIIKAVLRNDSTVKTHPKSTEFLFVCNQSASWLATPTFNVLPYLSENRYTGDNSTLTLKFQYSGACFVKPPSPTTAPDDDSHLSTGSILVILFFAGVLLYLIIGMAFQYSAGARNIELIPNYEFWADFPGLVMDGCVFFCRFVTCRTEGSLSYDSI